MIDLSSMDELDFLCNVILFPLLMSFVFVISFTWMLTRRERDVKRLSLHEFAKFAFTLHPDKGLMQQGLLWLSIITPIIYFIELLSIATKGYELRLDGEGFKTFTSIATLPLAILSLTIPLSVLVARFHSSQQTAEQIKANRQKNNTDLFHSHRKELFSYFVQVGEVTYHKNLVCKNKVHPRLHKVFFAGRPQDGVPVIKESSFIDVEMSLSSVRIHLIAILGDRDPDSTYSRYLVNFGPGIYRLSQMLGLPEVVDLMSSNPRVPCVVKKEVIQVETVGVTTDEAISAFNLIENFFHNLCDFANYSSPYFSDTKQMELMNEAMKKIEGVHVSDRVIEKLHDNEIFQALNNGREKEWIPKY